MGCASSTQVDANGSKKHNLGGSYPANRRPQQQPFTPPIEVFQNGTATAHFVSYGSGNALVQKPNNGIARPEQGGKDRFVSITLPAGVVAGQTIHVRAPDGRLNEIVVPPGFGPGSTFTVEFMDEGAPVAAPDYTTYYENKPSNDKPSYPTASASPVYAESSSTPATATATASSGGANGDDGFANGFNNAYFVPTATMTTANASLANDVEINMESYPSATDATPVYSSPPSYPEPKRL